MIGKLQVKFKPPLFYPSIGEFILIKKMGGDDSCDDKDLVNTRLSSSAIIVWAAITKDAIRK